MNTVGWGGGALGPLAVGLVSKYGRFGSKVANMSHAITWTGGIYLAAAAVLVVAAVGRNRATIQRCAGS
jgi:hypothetical protein